MYINNLNKLILKIFILLLFPSISFASNNYTDSLLNIIENTKSDSVKLLKYELLLKYYSKIDIEKSYLYANKAIEISKDLSSLDYFNCKINYINIKQLEGKYSECTKLYKSILNFAEKTKDTSIIAKAYNGLGINYYYLANYKLAYKNIKIAGDLFYIVGNTIGAAQSYNNTGIMYDIDGQPIKAIQQYLKALKIYEEEKIYEFLIGTVSNICVVYTNQKQYENSISLSLDNINYLDSIHNELSKADYYQNMAIAYDYLKEYDKAISYYDKSLVIAVHYNDKLREARTLTNISASYELQKKPNKSLEYALKALEIKKELDDIASITISQISVGNSYAGVGKYRMAIKYFKQGIKSAEKINYKEHLKAGYQGISKAFYNIQNYKNAYNYQSRYIEINDSLINSENNSVLNEMKTKYATEKKEQQIKLNNIKLEKQKEEIARKQAENDKQSAQLLLVIIGLSLALVLVFIAYRSYRIKKKSNILLSERNIEILQQKEEIEAQRDEITEHHNIVLTQNEQIEEKNEELNQLIEEVTSQRDEIETQRDTVTLQRDKIEIIHEELSQSIDYAQKIQDAMLPDDNVLKKYISDYFVMFKPRDVVSGDFYWWTHIDNRTVITASDCTGHGVPGAFMSMLGITFLREIVLKEYITKPNIILNKLRKEVIKALKQNIKIGGQKDGMDMSLISIDHKTNIVEFAGANNPLYIITERTLSGFENLIGLVDNSNFKLYELRPNKMPISIYIKMDNFVSHKIQLEKGDMLYLFSDGYADQFGGPKGKKFKYKTFKQLLLGNADKPMLEQKELLEQEFKNWQGNYEQIDDVVVLGIKI